HDGGSSAHCDPPLTFHFPLSTFHFPLYLSGLSSGAPVPDEPTNNVRPSGRVRSRPFARKVPFLARYPSTMMTVPGIRESFVKPRLNIAFGVPPSIIHCSTVPSGFLPSRWIHACGLIQSIFVTVPCSLIGCLA